MSVRVDLANRHERASRIEPGAKTRPSGQEVLGAYLAAVSRVENAQIREASRRQGAGCRDCDRLHAVDEVRRGRRDRYGVCDRKGSRSDAPELRQVADGPERLRQIASQGAHVIALRYVQRKVDAGWFASTSGDFEAKNPHAPRRQIKLFPPAGE